MITTTSITPQLLEKGLNEVFMHGYNQSSIGQIMSDRVFKFQNLSNGLQETDAAYAGIGLFDTIGENENVPLDFVTELGTTTYDIDIFSKGVGFSYKHKLGNRYDLFKDNVNMLAKRARQTQEINRFAVLRNSTSTLGYDGKALCATDHPTYVGTTSNLVNAAVSYESIKTAIQAFRDQVDYRGVPMPEDPHTLICPSDIWDDVVEFVGAENLPGGGAGDGDRNEVSFLATKFPGLRVVWTPYIGTSSVWSGGSNSHAYLISDSHKMKVLTREAINTWMTPWQDNDNIVTEFKAKYAETAGFSDWLGIVRVGA